MSMPNYLKYVLTLALKQKKSVIFLAVLLFASVSMRLVEPYLYKVIVDTLTNGLVAKSFATAQIETLITVVAIWFFIAIILNITSAETSFLVWYIGNSSSQEAHMTGYQRLLQLDYAKHMSQHSSRYTKIVDDADVSTWEMTNWWLARFFSAILGFFGMLIIALSVSWQMTLIAISVIPPTLWFIIRHVKKYEDEQRRVNKMWEEKHEHLSDQVSNIVTYKLNPHEEIFFERHKVYSEEAGAEQNAINKKWRLVGMLNPAAFARFLVLGAGIFFVKDGTITLGTLFMFMGLLNEILTPLHLMSDILPQYTRRAQHIMRLLRIFERADKVKNPAEPNLVPGVIGRVEFDHVSFSYPSEKSGFSLKDVS